MEKETTTNEIMTFLQEHMVTKEELKEELLIMDGKLSNGLKGVRKEIRKTEHRILDSMDKKFSVLS